MRTFSTDFKSAGCGRASFVGPSSPAQTQDRPQPARRVRLTLRQIASRGRAEYFWFGAPAAKRSYLYRAHDELKLKGSTVVQRQLQRHEARLRRPIGANRGVDGADTTE